MNIGFLAKRIGFRASSNCSRLLCLRLQEPMKAIFDGPGIAHITIERKNPWSFQHMSRAFRNSCFCVDHAALQGRNCHIRTSTKGVNDNSKLQSSKNIYLGIISSRDISNPGKQKNNVIHVTACVFFSSCCA